MLVNVFFLGESIMGFSADPSFLEDLITANDCPYGSVSQYVEKFRYDGTRGYTIFISKYSFQYFLRDGNHKAAAAFYLGLSIDCEMKDWRDMWTEDLIKNHIANGKTIARVVADLISAKGSF
jgi:hypothetical protein